MNAEPAWALERRLRRGPDSLSSCCDLGQGGLDAEHVSHERLAGMGPILTPASLSKRCTRSRLAWLEALVPESPVVAGAAVGERYLLFLRYLCRTRRVEVPAALRPERCDRCARSRVRAGRGVARTKTMMQAWRFLLRRRSPELDWMAALGGKRFKLPPLRRIKLVVCRRNSTSPVRLYLMGGGP